MTLALVVQHIIIFQQMLADIKVVAFHPFCDCSTSLPSIPLSIGRESSRFNARIKFFHLVAAEQAHQFILQGEVKARGTGIPLTGSATAQLVIDTAGFVPF